MHRRTSRLATLLSLIGMARANGVQISPGARRTHKIRLSAKSWTRKRNRERMARASRRYNLRHGG